jgi:hypothetical protein
MKIGKTFVHIQADMLQENKHGVSFLEEYVAEFQDAGK